MPTDFWLRLALEPSQAATVYIVQMHTGFMPEGTQGVWGHNIVTARGKRVWSACDGDTNECILHIHNRKVGKSSPLYFPPRCNGYAIASKLAVKEPGVKGQWRWLQEPETGILEKGGNFWRALSAAEHAAANPDEFHQDSKPLPEDWTKWFVLLSCSKQGATATALDPAKTGHSLFEPSPETLTRYQELYEKRITPWPDLERTVQLTIERHIAQQAGQEDAESVQASEWPQLSEAREAKAQKALAGGGEELDDIDFDEPQPKTPPPAAKPKVPFGKPVSDLVGNVEADPETAKALAAVYAELDTMKTYQLLNKLEQLYRRYYGQQYAFAVPNHLKRHGKASVKDFTDEELRDEIVDFETRAKAQEA
jgi:hypothetical protein